jgi:P4 family phage/plasmid primase-like protien
VTTVDEPGTSAPPDLMPAHQRELEESCIAPEVAAARGYETLYGTDEDRTRLKELRVPRWAWRDELAFPALLLPMYRVTGEAIGVQFKPATPQEMNGKRQKYASQTGVPNRLDVPPAVADAVRDPSNPLWITEGIKKADCLASYGRAVITLTGVFNWRSKLGTLGDWEDIPLAGRDVVICFDADAREKRTVMLAMQRLGRWLESKQARPLYLITPGEVERDGTRVDVKGVDDYLHAGGTMDGLREASARQLPTGAQDAAFTDAVLTDTAVNEALDGRFRWAKGLGWMQWTGKVWLEASDASVLEAVRQWAMEQFQLVLDEQRRDPNRNLQGVMDGWRGVLSAAKLSNLIKLSRGPLEVAAGDFDADPDLLNCPNGIVDLRTGVLTPHDPDMLMTKMTTTEFIKDARHPDWDKALEALPEEVTPWYQVRIGQAITGHMTPDDLIVICQGGGANGKSTVYDPLALALGKYHVQVSDRVILGGASDNHPTEIMDLMGSRYAVLEETPEARRLDTNRAKKLAGTREITGRRIRQDPVTFEATHSLFINSNYRPVVDETDHGTWRRLALVVWPFTFRKAASQLRGPRDRLGDPTLKDRIKNNPQALEAALAWAAEGARRWYEMERIMPPLPDKVEADTLGWRKESDLILSFIDEHLEFDLDACVAGTELRTVFNEWSKAKGAREWGDKTFIARFGGHDLCSQNSVEYKLIKNPRDLSSLGGRGAHKGSVRAWLGVAWKTETPESAEGNEEVKDPFTGGTARSGNSSNTSEVNGKVAPRIKVNFPSVTPVTETDSFRSEEPEIQDHPDYGDDPFAPLAEAAEAPVSRPALPVLKGAVGFDLETPSAGRLFTFRSDAGRPFARLNGLVDEDGQEVITNDPQELIELLERAPVLYGHNIFRFDLMALAWHHGADYDRLAAKAWDTYVDESVTDPSGGQFLAPWNQAGYYGLDKALERRGEPGKTDHLPELAREYAAEGLTGKAAEEDGYEKIPPDNERYRSYLSGDLKATGRLYAVQQAERPERMDYRQREQRVAYMQNRMTLSGWKIDVPLLRERVAEEAEKKEAALTWLNENAGIPLTKEVTSGRGKNKTTRTEPVPSPLTTTVGRQALIDAFAQRGAFAVPRTQGGGIALNKDAMGEGSYMVGKGASGEVRPGMLNPRVLSAFEARGADLDAIRELCEHIRIVTTSVQKYQEIMNHLIGDRVHGLVGEAQGSGRWAMVKPSVTNLGKRGGKVVQRAPFIADDGCVLIAFDLDQVDMRAFAGHCGDPEYVGMFVRGEDPHSMIADMVFGRHDGEWRERAKASGHGWNYGLSVNGLVNSGIERSLAERFDAGMNEGYPDLCSWRSEVRARGESGELLDNGFGRLMRVDPRRAYTQAPALMGQGTARDILVEGLLRLPQEYIPWMRGVVHDEVVFNVPEGRVEECIATVTEALTFDLAEATGGRLHSVPITTGASRPAKSWDGCYAKD